MRRKSLRVRARGGVRESARHERSERGEAGRHRARQSLLLRLVGELVSCREDAGRVGYAQQTSESENGRGNNRSNEPRRGAGMALTLLTPLAVLAVASATL